MKIDKIYHSYILTVSLEKVALRGFFLFLGLLFDLKF